MPHPMFRPISLQSGLSSFDNAVMHYEPVRETLNVVQDNLLTTAGSSMLKLC